MKFRVSVLSDKGMKKIVANVVADEYKVSNCNQWSQIEFWSVEQGVFFDDRKQTGEVMCDGAYIIEAVEL